MSPVLQNEAIDDARPAALHPQEQATLASLFAHACQEHAERTALTSGLQHLSYRQLGEAAQRVAGALAALHLQPGALIAIHLDRTPAMVAAMLGVVTAGAAYLPLDPTYPDARFRATLLDAQPAALLTTTSRAAALADLGIPTITLDDTLLAGQSPTPAVSQAQLSPDALAYVIYTSGSTGEPKGVRVSHRNVVRLLTQTQPWFRFTEQDVWTMFHSFAFDFSVWEMWCCLLTGGRLVLVPFSTSRSPDAFHKLLCAEQVTVLNQTPTAFRLLDEADQNPRAGTLSLRLVIFGGEALVLGSLAPWFARHGDTHPQLVNMYGITETTVHVTYRPITAADMAERDSLIGVPIPDLQIHLLDEERRPVATGETGEMYVGGPGVGLGYLRRPELTATRFLADPTGSGRLYRTGDLACRRADGELVYLGRADRQVKINGFRIELAEVEATLLRCPAAAQLCVAVEGDPATGQQLAAWYVPRPGATPETLHSFAAQNLPAHMRPSSFHPLQHLPLTANGKLDTAALPTLRKPPTPASGLTLEQTIAAAWAEILGRESVSPTENFFDAGGTSLHLIALRTRVSESLGTTIPMTWLFTHTTVRTLAARLSETPSGSGPSSLRHALTPVAASRTDARAAWLAEQAKRRAAR